MKNWLVEAEELEGYLQLIYKQLHQYPELGFKEYKTKEFIVGELSKGKIPYRSCGETGLVVEIKGSYPGKTLLLRVDMDALEIQEQNEFAYASKNKGIMHACGHDAHMTVGLGVAFLFNNLRKNLKGTVKIMFQPAEEAPPGGAVEMIRQGVLKKPKVDAAISIHTNPFIKTGQFGLRSGCILAATDRIYISLLGKAGHGGAPHQGIDAIVMTSQFVANLQNIVSRQIAPTDNAVITIGKINGGYRANVIADRVDLEGTVRTTKEAVQDEIEQRIEKLLASVAAYWGGDYTYRYQRGYPPTVNDQKMTELVKQSAMELLGEESVLELESALMSGDDFAYIARAVPSVFIEWGVGGVEEERFPWHHPRFNVDLSSFKYGVAVVSHSIWSYLEGEREK